MSTNDADFQYGPTPEGAQHEHTDIDPSIAYKFAVWLTVAMVISAGIVYATFAFFDSRAQSTDRATQVYPLAAGASQEPPAPRLQTQPFKDVYLLKQNEREHLSSYGWVDKNGGVVRIPIEDAMRLLEERGVPARAGQQAQPFNQVVQDSSSGRTSAPRN